MELIVVRRGSALHSTRHTCPMRRRVRLRWLVAAIVLVCVLIYEETRMGVAFISAMNRYNREVVVPITAHRNDSSRSIGIVIVVKDQLNAEQYIQARWTVGCYARRHGYALRVVDMATNETWREWCPQQDFMFARHCLASRLAADWPEQWLLFIDADMAVINPNHLIEEYIPADETTHVVFYNRVMNQEIMAGSYLFRNVDYSRRFLAFWGDYYHRLPNSFHGSDNGALHSVVAEFAAPELNTQREKCEELWRKATDYSSLSDYEVCMQWLLRGRSLAGLRLLPKASPSAWARDGWLTESAWTSSDFILHGWQLRRRDHMMFGRWHSPLVDSPSSVDLSDCVGPRAHLHWRYKDTFMIGEEKRREMIGRLVEEQEQRRKEMEERLERHGLLPAR